MPGTEVSSRASALIQPRWSVSTPAPARPRPAVLGTRPTATRTTSASSTLSFCADAGRSLTKGEGPRVTCTPVAVTSALDAVRASSQPMPRFFISRWMSLLRSASMDGTGRMRSRPSTTVTLEPRAWKMKASSQPMTPPPTTSIRFGMACSSKASSLVMMCVWSTGRVGRLRVLDPVAMMTLSPATSRTAPSAPCTRTRPALTTSPRPRSSVTLSLAQVFSRPPRRISETLFLRATMAGMSGRASPPPAMPNSARRWAVSRASAEALRVLVGMQPQFRQVPPMWAASTRVTCAPALAAENAAV
ncbi:hypothetical protein DSECCO2_470000 [anaerobic digester metagenome]